MNDLFFETNPSGFSPKRYIPESRVSRSPCVYTAGAPAEVLKPRARPPGSQTKRLLAKKKKLMGGVKKKKKSRKKQRQGNAAVVPKAPGISELARLPEVGGMLILFKKIKIIKIKILFTETSTSNTVLSFLHTCTADAQRISWGLKTQLQQ